MTDLKSLPAHSRVWVYQGNRIVSMEEAFQIENKLQEFVSNWAAHSQSLYAAAEFRYNQFVILAVDEAQMGASGCSIDSSVRFIKSLEVEYKISFTDRMLFAFKSKEGIKTYEREEFENALIEGEITNDTIVFNNLVQTKELFDSSWEVPLKNSWHATFFASSINKIAHH